MPQGDDVVVTENEIYHYDGASPSHAVNALFVGGIPETPDSPGYIPHFTTESGVGYAQIVDSTKSKNKPKDRPALGTFKPLPKRKDSEKDIIDITLSTTDQNEDTDSFSEPDYNPDIGVDNPGYDPMLFNLPSAGQRTDKKETSPYDYIDHNKLKRDDEEFERNMASSLTHPKTVDLKMEQEPEEERYKKFLPRSSEVQVGEDGYLRSPTRNEKFQFPDSKQS